MRNLIKYLFLLAFVLPTAAFAQIRNSRHDLSNTATGPGPKNTNVAENQICKYCHTPHRAQSTQLVWNHTQTATVVFNWGTDLDGSPLTATRQGTALPTALRNASKRCLGCHDGTVALGDVSNAGGGVAGVIPGLASIAGETNAAGQLSNAAYIVGAGGNMGGNHPISIPYAGETYGAVTSVVLADSSLGNYWSTTTTGCVSNSGVCTSAPATDGRNGIAINLIPFTPGATTNLGVECVSCHEPHNKYDPNPYFTRVNVNAASGLCRSCHNK